MYFGEQSFIRYILCKYFLLVCGLSSGSLGIVFHRAEVLNFNDVQLTGYCSRGSCLWSCTVKVITEPKDFRTFPYVLLCFTVRSMIHSELISLKMLCKICGQIHCFACDCPVIPALLVEKMLFAPCIVSAPLSRMGCSMYMGIFLDSLSCS